MFDEKVLARFWKKVNREGDCWMWTAANFGPSHPYGGFRFNGKSHSAHRISWAIANGAIPDGMCVCHRCDTPLCVNPSHLFLGTKSDNNKDRAQKGRSADMDRHPRAKLTSEIVAFIRSSRESDIALGKSRRP